ncbi:hypothetical protein FQN54_002459 [Arachnomyces sp. PD_36]|nr:hypothetical protein FQN54_002459 [Arachnomyces sp. PD_36]
MERWEGAYITASEIIESAPLSAFEQLAIREFMVHAQIPCDAGQYVLDRISKNPDDPVEETLRSVREDLRTLALRMNREHGVNPETDTALRQRENQRCCVTGWREDVKPTYIVSPSILQDPDFQPAGYLRILLEAIISRGGVDELFALLASRRTEKQLQNLWLMAPRPSNAFRGGHIKMTKSPHLESNDGKVRNLGESGGWGLELNGPEAISLDPLGGHESFYKPPSTTDPDSYPLPARFLLQTHAKISLNLHLFAVDKSIQKGWPPVDKEPYTLGRMPRFLLQSMLHILPRFLRIPLFKFIDRQVEYWDPEQKNSDVKLLPFGLVLKKGRAHTANEANALLMVEKHTSINAPRLIDSVMVDETWGFIFMTRIFGDRLDRVYYRTTHEELNQLGKDLAKWIAELRQIPNESKYLIANTLGNAISDHQFEHETWGPFNSVGDFNNHLVRNVFNLQHNINKRPLSILQERTYQACFTHSDLHMTNIFLRQGRLHGLIDFEDAGFKPEYWEFTRALWPYGGSKRDCYIYRTAFEGKYDDEWDAEAFILSNSPMFL